MKPYLIKIYFKGGVLVPFYVSVFLSFMFLCVAFLASGFRWSELSNNPSLYEMLKITFFSGITGLCSLTAFLNSFRKIADNIFYSLLSWFLLPYSCIAYILASQVDWTMFRNTKNGDPMIICLYLFIFFFHFIGLIIAFQSFRATVVINKNDEDIMNDVNDRYAMLNSDKNVQVSDTTEAK